MVLISLLAATQQAGSASGALFRGLGLVPQDFEMAGCLVTPEEAHTVVRRALLLLDRADLGLTLGVQARSTERGALALGMMAAATLGEAIELALRFPGNAGSLMALHAERVSGVHRMIAEPMPGTDDVAPFLVDIIFASSVRIDRQLTHDAAYAPATVELTRERPDNAAAYEAHFACPVHFGRRRNVLATASARLDQPLPLANVTTYRLVRQMLEREFERQRAMAVLGISVERAIRRALPSTPTPADLADSLHLGERSLRRKLAQAGSSFRGLLDEARKARAFELMSGTNVSMTSVAEHTGFSDVRAFSRAFKRWTGKPPSALLTSLATISPNP